jgi:hypothetical protein
VIATLRPDCGHPIVNERPHHIEQQADRCQTALEAARRADTEQRPHPEAKIEGAGMNEQSFEHVLVSAHVRPPEPTCLVEMRTRSLEQFPASAEEAFTAIPVDASSIRVDRVSFGFLVRPRLRSAIRFANVGANLQRLQIVHRAAAVIALVGDDFLDHRDRVVRDGADRFESTPIVFPSTKPAALRHCSTHVKTARCVSRSISRRVREIVEWSGGASSRPTPRTSRNVNESAARQAMPRSESMPSK